MEHAEISDKKLVLRISLASIVINIVLSLLKGLAGVIAHSGAMISDAVHSLSDVFSTFIVIFGYNASLKDSDGDHPYGHERMECVAAIVLATVLLVIGVEIGISGVNKILAGVEGTLAAPGVLALWAAIVSILVKEAMFWLTRWGARKVDSGALMADAWHHRSDALSSVGCFIGIFGARLGLPILDPIASLVICIFIVRAAYQVFRDALTKMVDQSCDQETIDKMKAKIMKSDGVAALDLIRTRIFGSKIYVDVEIAVAGEMTLTDAHSIAEEVHDMIEAEFPKVKHCMIHVNPSL